MQAKPFTRCEPIEPLEARQLFSTYTVNPAGGADYADLETAIVSVAAGSTLSVAPGTYTAHPTSANGSASTFWVNKPLTIVSTGGPSVTTLVVPAGQMENVLISSSNVTVDGFTLQGGTYGVYVQDYVHQQSLTGEALRHLVVNPVTTGNSGDGILFQDVSDSRIDGCTVGRSYANGIHLDGGSDDDVVSGSSVAGTTVGYAILVRDSDRDQVLDDTVTGSALDGVFLLGSSDCVVTGNAISGHAIDGITMTNDSDRNLVSLNTIVSDAVTAGRPNGAGIWMNDDSDDNVISDNTASGQAECGIDVFVSSNNRITGNNLFGNGEGGVFVFDALDYAASTGTAPAHTVIADNDIHDNLANSGVILRGASDTTVTGNAITGGYTGKLGSSLFSGLEVQRSSDTLFTGNTLMGLLSGVYAYATATDLSIYGNRFINVGENYAFTGATVTFDGGPTLGGNYWQKDTAAAGVPYTDFVYDAAGERGGGYVDHYPLAAESLGLSYAATVTAPAAGTTMATGSRRAIQWTAAGAARVNLYYASAETGDVAIATNQPNNGVYAWTVPALAAGSDYVIKVVPLNSTGTVEGAAAASGTFTVSGTGNLLLVSPAADQSTAAGGSLDVTWVEQAPVAAVDVQLQIDGGDWTTVATGVTVDHATITLPTASTNAARVRIVDEANNTGDTQDGFFRITGTAAVTVAASAVPVGNVQPVTWTSPAAAATVDVAFWDGSAFQPIATALPDVGHADWYVPAAGSVTGSSVRVTFYNAAGTQIGTDTSGTFDITSAAATTVPTTTPTPTSTPTPTPTPTPTATVLTAGQGAVVVDAATAFPSAPAAAGKGAKLTVQFSLDGVAKPTLGRVVRVVNGKAAVATAKLRQAGTYTMSLTDAAGDTTTQTLTVQPGVAAKVAFVSMPATLDGQSAVSVRLVDRFGNLTTAADGTTVAVRLARSSLGHGATLAGTTTATVAGGTATFPDLAVTGATNAAGRGHLVVTDAKLSSPASAAFGIA